MGLAEHITYGILFHALNLMSYLIYIHREIIQFSDTLPKEDSELLLGWLSIQRLFSEQESDGVSESIRKIVEFQQQNLHVWRFAYDVGSLRLWRFLARIWGDRLYFLYHFFRRQYNYQTFGEKYEEIKRRYNAIEERAENDLYLGMHS